MEFAELSKLQCDIDELLEHQVASLELYHLPIGGFKHKYLDQTSKFSKASTATCIMSIIATGKWTEGSPWYPTTEALVRSMLDQESWTSAGLPKRNPFTVAFLLEAVSALLSVVPSISLSEAEEESKRKAVEILQRSLQRRRAPAEPGAAHLQNYPPSAYLTQLVVRSLLRVGALTDNLRTMVRDWSRRRIEHELALCFSGSSLADAYALAYAVMLFADCSGSLEATPTEDQILKTAVSSIFKAQLSDGSWPRSRPLFHYPKFGNAYSYEYEMLTQLLQCGTLTEHLLGHLPELALAVKRLRQTEFQLSPRNWLGWASGHHPQLKGPESWSTASAYHFLHVLDRLLSEPFRQSVFAYVGAKYLSPTSPKKKQEDFAKDFWDSELEYPKGTKASLRDTLFRALVKPVADHSESVANGDQIPRHVPISAIFFGPPGTSKTQLADHIAKFLGWPKLSIDPSHLVRKGFDQVQAEANTIFGMLASIERVVVLLDEFDEMVRERTETSETLSRFLTTAMLPKLALISDRRRIVLILATNHIEAFDFAVRRPGRFDMIVQVMPPALKTKLDKNKKVKCTIERYEADLSDGWKDSIAALTYTEFHEFAKIIEEVENKDALQRHITECYGRCTLSQDCLDANNKMEKWTEICKRHSGHNRIPWT